MWTHKSARHGVKIELDGIVALVPLVGVQSRCQCAPNGSSVRFRLGSLLTKVKLHTYRLVLRRTHLTRAPRPLLQCNCLFCGHSLSMSTTLSRTETYSLLSLALACVGVLANTFQGDGEPLIASIAFSGLAFCSSYALIRWLGQAFMRRGFKGKDMSKLKQTEMYV